MNAMAKPIALTQKGTTLAFATQDILAMEEFVKVPYHTPSISLPLRHLGAFVSSS